MSHLAFPGLNTALLLLLVALTVWQAKYGLPWGARITAVGVGLCLLNWLVRT